MKKRIKKILVIGGAGYVGCILVPMLLKKGYGVHVFDNLMYGQCVLLNYFKNKNFDFVKADITDRKEVKKAMREMDFVVHLAAIVGGPACDMLPERAKQVNHGGTININKARKNRPIIYLSTGSIYGKLDHICTENSPVNPLSLYSKTKHWAEKEVTHNDNYIIFRPATAFGLSPRMRLDLLINDFTYKAIKTNNLVVYERNAKRTFVHVNDFARAIVHAIENFDKMKNNIYNLGSEKLNITKGKVAEKIKTLYDFYLHFAEFGEDPDKRDYSVSYEKLRSKGFNVKMSLEEGIKELIRGYRMISVHNPYSNYIK